MTAVALNATEVAVPLPHDCHRHETKSYQDICNWRLQNKQFNSSSYEWQETNADSHQTDPTA